MRSIIAAALAAAWYIEGTGDNSDCGVGSGFSLLIVDGVGFEGLVVTEGELSDVPRLALEAERRMVGVRRDSRALGSSSEVYFPIAGR